MSNSQMDSTTGPKSVVNHESVDGDAKEVQPNKSTIVIAPAHDHNPTTLAGKNHEDAINQASNPPSPGATLDEPFKKVDTLAETKTKTKDPNAQSQPSPSKPMTMVTRLERLGEAEAFIDCPYCEKRTKTKVTHTASNQTSIAAIFLCLCCGIIPAIFPFICHCCDDTEHRCGECSKQVALKSYDGKTKAMYPENEATHVVSKYR